MSSRAARFKGSAKFLCGTRWCVRNNYCALLFSAFGARLLPPPFFPSLQRPRKENNAKRANCPTHRRWGNRGAQGRRRRRRRHCSLTSRNASTDRDARTGCTNVCTGCTKPGNRVPKPSPSTMEKPKMRTTHAAKKRAWRSGAVSTCDKRDKNLTPPPFFGSL